MLGEAGPQGGENEGFTARAEAARVNVVIADGGVQEVFVVGREVAARDKKAPDRSEHVEVGFAGSRNEVAVFVGEGGGLYVGAFGIELQVEADGFLGGGAAVFSSLVKGHGAMVPRGDAPGQERRGLTGFAAVRSSDRR